MIDRRAGRITLKALEQYDNNVSLAYFRFFLILLKLIAIIIRPRYILINVARSVVCCLTVMYALVNRAKTDEPITNDAVWGTADSRGLNEPYIRQRVHIGAIWIIRLNDPCAQRCGLLSNYFDYWLELAIGQHYR